MTYSDLKRRVWRTLEPQADSTRLAQVVQVFLLVLIFLNVIAVIIETMPGLADLGPAFSAFNVFSVLVFTVEYISRVWSCTVDARYRGPLWGRLRYMRSPLVIIDLLAVAPFYLPAVGIDLRSIRILRVFRFMRALKLARYSRSIQTMGAVLARKREELLIALAALVAILVVASSLVYFAENEAQPDAFSSIPATMWWGMATLSTVGYGDIYPVTVLGKTIGSVIAVLGIGLFAVPAGILASGFAEERSAREEEARTCPHCGSVLDD